MADGSLRRPPHSACLSLYHTLPLDGSCSTLNVIMVIKYPHGTFGWSAPNFFPSDQGGYLPRLLQNPRAPPSSYSCCWRPWLLFHPLAAPPPTPFRMQLSHTDVGHGLTPGELLRSKTRAARAGFLSGSSSSATISAVPEKGQAEYLVSFAIGTPPQPVGNLSVQ